MSLQPVHAFNLSYPAGFEQAVHLTPSEFEQQLLLMAALKMFELGKLSAGKAAELANLPRVTFLESCSRYRISPFNYPDEAIATELAQEIALLERLGL